MPDKKAKVSPAIFRILSGMIPTKTTNEPPLPRGAGKKSVSRFSEAETQAHYKKIETPAVQSGYVPSAAGLVPYLTPVHNRVGKLIVESEQMMALAPEIEQSKVLISSSIMSPNDLQEGKFFFNFDDIPGMKDQEAVCENLEKILSEHFNDTLRLPVKSYDWLGDIMYGSGAKPVLILPTGTLESVRNSSSVIPGNASFDEQYEKLIKSDQYLLSGEPDNRSAGLESLYPKITDTDTKISRRIMRACYYDMVNANIPIPKETGISLDDESKYFEYDKENKSLSNSQKYDAFIDAMESMTVKFTKTIEEGDTIRITENPEIIRFATIHNQLTKEQLNQKIRRKYGAENNPLTYEELVVLHADPEGYENLGFATHIVLPTESVVPVTVPGSPDQHLLYLILIDQYGQPVRVSRENFGNPAASDSSSVGQAFNAVFGSEIKANFGRSDFGAYTESTANVVFQNIFDRYIRARVKKITGYGDTEISRIDAVSTCMFYRMLHHKRTTVVAVPPGLMTYFAFGYHPDGTGRSKLEDISTLLSLRTRFIIAGVMAAARDSVEHKRVEMNIPSNMSNPEMLIDMVRKILVDKTRMSGSFDPNVISREIASSGIDVVLPNIFGSDAAFKVDTSVAQGTSQRPDEGLLEQLNNLIGAQLDVPAPLLNSANELEFSKSIATMNIFFAKKIRRYSSTFCSSMTLFVREYIRCSPGLKKKLLDCLSQIGTEERNLKDMEKNRDGSYVGSRERLLESIVSKLKVTLPEANIAVDRSQLDLIREFSQSIEELSQLFFNPDTVPSDDPALISAITIRRAHWKSEMIKNFIQGIGMTDLVSIPADDESTNTSIADHIQVIQNTAVGIERHMAAMKMKQEESIGGDYGGGSDYDTMGSDTDDGLSDDPDPDMGMGEPDEPDQGSTPEEPVEPEIKEEEQPSDEEKNTDDPVSQMYLSFPRDSIIPKL